MHIHELLVQIFSSSLQTLTIFGYALLGGFVPALFWLWFWLHEKHNHTEPRRVIVKVFLLGMVAVFIAYMLQKGIAIYLTGRAASIGIMDFENQAQSNQLLTLIYVIIEETLKFGAAYVVAFKTKIFDEPIDAFIYLMTAAVGFSAMENTLYLIQPLLSGHAINTIVTGHMRFIGSSILHVASSGVLSVCIGLSFYKSFFKKEAYVWIGMILACLIHWAFNVFLVINDGSSAFLVFSSVWIVTIGLILALERVKQLKRF
ncbi:MAG: PrsW family glutamic-type intramembrane protease [Patescibacteria group bacterium]